jgi:hypothetical protein
VSKISMVHKKLTVATLTLGGLLGAFASNCPVEPPSYVIAAAENLDSAITTLASIDKPKSWFESLQQLTLGATTSPIQQQLQQLSIDLDGIQLTQCDTRVLVPKVEKFAHSLGGQISKLNSESFDFNDLIKFESLLFQFPYTCDDYLVLSRSISNLNSAVSHVQYDLGSQLSSFPVIPLRSKYCGESNQDSLSKYLKMSSINYALSIL